MLEASHISGGYGMSLVLEEVSLTVHPGEIVALLGANGAGKSTLLNALSGHLGVTSGQIILDGVDMTGKHEWDLRRAGLSLVPEGRRLFRRMSALDNLRLGAYVEPRRKRKAVVAHRLETVFDIFPALREMEHRPAGLLSGGQQQMLAFGRALMGDPKYLLLDEPSMGLAPSILEIIKSAVNAAVERGIGVLLVEQMVQLGLDLAHTVFIMRSGCIVACEPAAVFRDDAEFLTRAYFGG